MPATAISQPSQRHQQPVSSHQPTGTSVDDKLFDQRAAEGPFYRTVVSSREAARQQLPSDDKSQGKSLIPRTTNAVTMDCKSRWMRRLRSFVVINGSLIALGLMLHQSLSLIQSIPFVAVEAIVLAMKNTLLIVGVDFATNHKANIGDYRPIPNPRGPSRRSIDWWAVMSSVVKFSIQESLTYRLSVLYGLVDVPHQLIDLRSLFALIVNPKALQLLLYSYFSFIWTSFIFEIIFDLCHYWGHRLLHEQQFLYRTLHLAHHKCINPTVHHTFEDTVGGNIMTNCIPHIVALTALAAIRQQPLPHEYHAVLLVYKSFVEVSGHSGKDVGRASSFPQCKWLPTSLGVELYTQDHHFHHRNCKANFSKRFSMWDKIFGTFQRSPELLNS